jgi:hypothetical protein
LHDNKCVAFWLVVVYLTKARIGLYSTKIGKNSLQAIIEQGIMIGFGKRYWGRARPERHSVGSFLQENARERGLHGPCLMQEKVSD